MALLHYRWWVPYVGAKSRRPALVRLFTDIEFVAPWAYLLVPAIMASAVVLSPGLHSGEGFFAAAGVSLAWVILIRARFSMAVAVHASRRRRRLRSIKPSGESRLAA